MREDDIVSIEGECRRMRKWKFSKVINIKNEKEGAKDGALRDTGRSMAMRRERPGD